MQLGKKDLGPGSEYPFVLPIVIYKGKPRWTAATDIADLLPPGLEQVLGRRPRLWYLLIEAWERDPALLPLDNVFATIVTFEQAPTAEALEELAGSLDDRLEAIGEPALNAVFRTWIELVLTLRHKKKAEQLLPLLRRLTDQDDILAVADAVIDCATAEEFLTTVGVSGGRTPAG